MKVNGCIQQGGAFPLKRLVTHLAGVFIGLGAVASAHAFGIETENSDLQMSWDNTFKYSAGWRVRDIDSNVAPDAPGGDLRSNINDGDRNFKKNAMISNRVDWLSEFDLRYQKAYGFRVSAAAWYDDVYHKTNDNPGMQVNSSSAAFNEFTDATRKLHGRKGEFRDAFVYANLTPGDINVNLKGGQFTQLYGETLFFGYNGIAGAQTPLDLVRALSVPNSQFKEIALPVKQASVQVQVNPNLSFGAYYQLEWKKNRIPGAGSYFSFADFVDAGGERIFLNTAPAGPDVWLNRGADFNAKDSGQGGAQLKFKSGDSEYGLYAAQFHDKMPQFYARPGVNPGNGGIGDYMQTFGEKIKTIGASYSTVLGETNVSAELSARKDQPLMARGNLVIDPTGLQNNNTNPGYPVGKTLHLNASAITVLSESPLWDGASFVGEFAYNRVMSVSANAGALDPNRTRSASALQFVFTPEYFQVTPGLDLQLPIGVGYGIQGNSSVAGVGGLMPVEGGGNISISLKGEYQKTWIGSIGLTHYFGSAGSIIDATGALTYANFHRDRDFISLSVQRTF